MAQMCASKYVQQSSIHRAVRVRMCVFVTMHQPYVQGMCVCMCVTCRARARLNNRMNKSLGWLHPENRSVTNSLCEIMRSHM